MDDISRDCVLAIVGGVAFAVGWVLGSIDRLVESARLRREDLRRERAIERQLIDWERARRALKREGGSGDS